MAQTITDMELLEKLGQAPIRHQPRDELERFVRQVWTLLDGVVGMMGDTLWADTETTMHEAMIEIVNEYRPELAAQLQRELEL